MSDQNDPQSPSTPTVASTVEAKVEQVASFTFKSLWEKYGILFIIMGALLLIAKYSSVFMEFLSWSSKKDLQDAQKVDTQLKTQEDAANKQADALVQAAKDLPKQEGTVSDDWYTKK